VMPGVRRLCFIAERMRFTSEVLVTSRLRTFAFAFVCTLGLFIGINLVAAHVQSDCAIAGVLGVPFCNDDIRRLGFPLLVWEEGGFAYRNIFDVTALILDIGIGLSACTIMGLIGQLFVKRATHYSKERLQPTV
jgi:hypothetical protein